MTPIDIQVSRSKVKVKGQAYSIYHYMLGKGGISVLQTSIFKLYMWRYIDEQVHWRSWTYGRNPTP